MRKTKSLLLFMAGLALFGVEAYAQTPTAAAPVDAAAPTTQAAPAAQTPAAPAAAAPAPVDPGILHQWGTDFSFLVDGYIEGNFDSPSSGFNQLRAFDVRSDMPHLNMAMLTIDHARRSLRLPSGRRLRRDVRHHPRGQRAIPPRGTISSRPMSASSRKSWHGVELDAGEFVTSAGAEVIETNQNYNYIALPALHLGDSVFPYRIPAAVSDRPALHRKLSGGQRLEQRRADQQREDLRFHRRLRLEESHLEQ